jgi:hypothetical protein
MAPSSKVRAPADPGARLSRDCAAVHTQIKTALSGLGYGNIRNGKMVFVKFVENIELSKQEMDVPSSAARTRITSLVITPFMRIAAKAKDKISQPDIELVLKIARHLRDRNRLIESYTNATVESAWSTWREDEKAKHADEKTRTIKAIRLDQIAEQNRALSKLLSR